MAVRHTFSETARQIFPEILYEVRVQKVRKNVPRALLIIFIILAKKCQKFVFFAENGGFFFEKIVSVVEV